MVALNCVVILVQMPLYLCFSSIIMIRRITTIIIMNNNNNNKRRVNELNHISTTVETDALRSVVSHDAHTHKNKPWANLTCFSHHEESPLSKPAWWKNPTNYHLLPPVDKHDDILLTALSWPFTCQWVGEGVGVCVLVAYWLKYILYTKSAPIQMSLKSKLDRGAFCSPSLVPCCQLTVPVGVSSSFSQCQITKYRPQWSGITSSCPN